MNYFIKEYVSLFLENEQSFEDIYNSFFVQNPNQETNQASEPEQETNQASEPEQETNQETGQQHVSSEPNPWIHQWRFNRSNQTR